MLADEERRILAGVEGAAIAVNDQGNIVHASPVSLAMLGWSESLVGRPLLDIIPARLQQRHLTGFHRYVDTGVSRLEGKAVRVPAMRFDGSKLEVDLTIRVFKRPDGSKLAVATLAQPALGGSQRDILYLESAFQRRAYELV